MSTRTRYVVQVPGPVRLSAGFSLEDVAVGLPAAQRVRSGRAGLQVLELDADEVAELARNFPGLLIEEDQDLVLLGPMPDLGFQIEGARGLDHAFEVSDAETQAPIPGVTVFLQSARATYRAETGRDGKATVTVYETDIQRVIVSPASQYWSRVIDVPTPGAVTAVSLARLAPQGAAAWSRAWLGLGADFPFQGQGVKLAVLDGGVADHPDLSVAGGLNTLDGEDPQDFRRDERGHGTHCAGVIAGRNGEDGVLGIAPAVELYSIKAFPGGRLSDLLEGLQWSIDNGIDVVSMSLGLRAPSAQLALKVAEAVGHGIVLVAAAGNDAGALSYPAAFDDVIAVAAFGSTQAFPADSAHALRVGKLHNDASSLFVANFSNSGTQTDFIAPGVAIVSSVPGGHAAWDGTSMACPFVSGLAAVVLSAHPETSTRDVRRVRAVRGLLASTAVDLDLPASIQGAGVPNAQAALAEAIRLRQAEVMQATAQQDSLRLLAPLIADLELKQQEIKSLLEQLG